MALDTRPAVREKRPPFYRSSADVVLVLATLAATGIVVLIDGPPVLRAPLAFLTVFLVPGYMLSIALFPVGESTMTDGEWRRETSDGITLLDRAVLSVGLSLSLVVLVGLLINASPVALSATTLLGGLAAATLAAIPVAVVRRRRTPAALRYVPFDGHGSGITGSQSGYDPLRVVLALSLLFAGGAIAFSGGIAGGSGSVTEFYMLTDSGDGELVAADYPTNFTSNESRPLSLAVGNREGQEVSYAVVGQLQRVDRRGDAVVVRERRQIYDERVSVPAGETRTLDTTVTPRDVGQYRLTYLLYAGDPPGEPRADDAYREIHLWIEVDEASGGTIG